MEVNYKEMPGKATQMQNLGKSLNAEMKNAYSSVNELRSTWYGARYNTLIALFNKIVEPVNKILALVVCTIPEQLGIIATNYSKVDGEPVAAVEPGSVEAIEALVDSDTSSMGYEESAAAEAKTTVMSNIDSAKADMQSIVETFGTIQWESEARESYAAQINTLKGEIDASLDSIKNQFQSLMEQASQDMAAAETANDVNQ